MISLDIESVKTIIEQIEGSENQQRKKDAWKSYEIKNGLLNKYVKGRLKEMFPDTYQNYTVADYSLLKKIVEKKAQAYKEAPIRSLENESDREEYYKILKDYKFNFAMSEIDALYNEHKYCALAVFPKTDDETGLLGFNFVPLAPYEYDVIKSNDGEVEAVILSYPSTEITGSGDGINQLIAEPTNADEGLKRKYVFWTEKEHRVFEVSGSGDNKKMWESLIEGNENGINPFGMIPVIHFPEAFTPNYPISSPLPNQTVEINALFSIYLQSGSMQVGQLVLKFPNDQQITTVHQGIFSGMKLPQSKNPDDPKTEAEYISPSPDLAGHKDSIITFMSMILDEQGINGNQVVNPSESFSSGVDRLLASADVQAIIEANQNKYMDIEHEVYELVKKMSDIYGGHKYTSENLVVKYQKPKMMISDSEKLENLKKKKELGIFADWELLIDYNPNLSEQEAKDKLQQMRTEKVSNVNSMFGNVNNAN